MREGLCVIPEKVPAARRGRAVGMFIDPEKDRIWGIEEPEWAIDILLRRKHSSCAIAILCNGSWLLPFAHIVQPHAFSAYRITKITSFLPKREISYYLYQTASGGSCKMKYL